MKCKTVHRKLIFFFDGELNLSENEEISSHLHNCKKCAQLFEEIKSVYNKSNETEQLKPNPFLYTRIKQNIEKIGSRKLSNPVYIRILQPILSVVLLAGGISLGIFLGNSYDSQQPENYSVSSTNEFYMNETQLEILEANLLNK